MREVRLKIKKSCSRDVTLDPETGAPRTYGGGKMSMQCPSELAVSWESLMSHHLL